LFNLTDKVKGVWWLKATNNEFWKDHQTKLTIGKKQYAEFTSYR
jgi:hypothetical protein